jgi:O-antigen/teichoic acid export membrane protein
MNFRRDRISGEEPASPGILTLLRNWNQGSILDVIRNSGWVTAGGILTTGITIIQSILVARLLGAQTYGFFAMIVASAGLVLLVADFRTWEVAIKFLPEKLHESRKESALATIGSLLWLDLLAGCAAAAAVILLRAPLSTLIVSDSSLVDPIILYACSLPATIAANGICVGALRSLDKFGQLAARGIVVALVNLLLLAVSAYLGLGLKGILVAYLAAEWLNGLLGLLLTNRALRTALGSLPPPALNEMAREFSAMKSFLFQTWFGGTVKGMQTQADVFLLGLLASPVAAGYYRLARDLSGGFARIGNPIQDSVLPVFSKLMNQGKAKAIRELSVALALLLSIPMTVFAVFISCVADEFIAIAAGANYAPVSLPFILLTIGVCLNVAVGSWARPSIVVQSRLRASNWAAVLVNIVALIAYIAVIPRYQEAGAAAVTLGVYILVCLLNAGIALYKPSTL